MELAVHMKNNITGERRIKKVTGKSGSLEDWHCNDFHYGSEWNWTGTEPFSNVAQEVTNIGGDYYVRGNEGKGLSVVRAEGTLSVKTIQVIVTESDRGSGTERDPVRRIKQYWDMDGNYLAEWDEKNEIRVAMMEAEIKREAAIKRIFQGEGFAQPKEK